LKKEKLKRARLRCLILFVFDVSSFNTRQYLTISLILQEAAQDDVERSLGFDFDELCNDVCSIVGSRCCLCFRTSLGSDFVCRSDCAQVEEHKEALEKSAEEVTVNRKQSVNLDTSETAVFSLDDFGDLEIEDTSAQDNVSWFCTVYCCCPATSDTVWRADER